MGAELGQFFRDQEATKEQMGHYGNALRFHANRFSGYLSQHAEVEGVVGLGFPFYLPTDIPLETRIDEIARYTGEKKEGLPSNSLRQWECPSCFTDKELSGTRNHTCSGCAIESFRPSDVQKLYMDLDLLCVISGDESVFRNTAEQIAYEMRMGLFPPLDFDINATLSQYSAFVKDPFEIPPPVDLHFVREEEFSEVIASIGNEAGTHLHALSAYEIVKPHTMPFGLGSLFLTEPVLLNKEISENIERKRREFVQSPEDAAEVLAKIKEGSGQVRRMFSQPDLEQMLIKKMVTPIATPDQAVLVFGTTMHHGVDDGDLKKNEAIWRIKTAMDASQNKLPILITGIESEEMASWLIASDPSFAPNVFIEPLSGSTEENIRNIAFFENKLSGGNWKAASNKWHLERIRWTVPFSKTGFTFTPIPIEETMLRDGVSPDAIEDFQLNRYEHETPRIKNAVGFTPQFS